MELANGVLASQPRMAKEFAPLENAGLFSRGVDAARLGVVSR